MIGDTTCVHSGVQGGRPKVGVAILLSERFGRYLKEWRCVDERLVWIRLKVEGVWVSLVQVYAPTDDSSVASKDELFLRLQEAVGRVARGDLLIVDTTHAHTHNTHMHKEISSKDGHMLITAHAFTVSLYRNIMYQGTHSHESSAALTWLSYIRTILSSICLTIIIITYLAET